MARICGVLKVALREDDPGSKIRLAAEDVEGETVAGKPIEPGLYFCSREAFDKFAPRVVERLKRTPAVGGDGKPVLDPEGKPLMVLHSDASFATVAHNVLC